MTRNPEMAAAEDMFEMAAMVEQGGYDFYERLRAAATEPGVKKELEFLRDDEAAHKAFFHAQLKAVGRTPGSPVPAGLQAALEKDFLGPLREIFASSEVKDNFRTLGFGMQLEQKSIDFYATLRTAASAAQKGDIDRIIAEEKTHLQKLQLMRAHY